MKKIYLILLMVLPLFTFGQELVSVNDAKPIEVKGFKMYPNPAYGEEVYITTETNGNKEIQIFDVFGEVVLHERIATNTLNISKLVPGVYVLQVTENKKTMTRKLVVK
ncbi:MULTISPECIES: T9SS type A sorting domain-containing protein [Croceitalea]|uniref:T9SS type A sorting domain-containing protein n=1 Tax=Croceitalea vernalis TaxID=3075599 RepID=A0ABU3BCC1_9FLAO|nr:MULTISPECIES: T9SS type A sorting domain-containing protein [unclassified Croceitalea]MDT0538339.1 T9SS type A sorting domain-containing protein [Croceitalea sp. P059]MDT0620123.1 T9SS type A sorting domain-containing protein [Croceitalea sp. P007]